MVGTDDAFVGFLVPLTGAWLPPLTGLEPLPRSLRPRVLSRALSRPPLPLPDLVAGTCSEAELGCSFTLDRALSLGFFLISENCDTLPADTHLSDMAVTSPKNQPYLH